MPWLKDRKGKCFLTRSKVPAENAWSQGCPRAWSFHSSSVRVDEIELSPLSSGKANA